jgi:hypothetical protein
MDNKTMAFLLEGATQNADELGYESVQDAIGP